MDGFFVAKFKKFSNKFDTGKDEEDEKPANKKKQKQNGRKANDTDNDAVGFNDEEDAKIIQGMRRRLVVPVKFH